MEWFILNSEKQVVPATWQEYSYAREDFDKNFVVKRSAVGEVRISTVFLGLEHHGETWFETMFFSSSVPSIDCYLFRRYQTYGAAEEGHTGAEHFVAGWMACLGDMTHGQG